MCAALDWPYEPATATIEGRLANRASIDARLAEWTCGRPAEEAAGILQDHGVSAMPVMGPQDHLSDPHLLERGFIVRLEHAEVGSERHAGNPVRMSRLAQRTAASAPCLGADTEAVLGSLLGIGADEVAVLRERGVCR